MSPHQTNLFLLIPLTDGWEPIGHRPWHWQVYSNGASEIILGKAIKQLSLPREEIVVMTKVRYDTLGCRVH